MKRTLPTDSTERKGYPLASGLLDYFPAALAGVARISKEGNDKHNPGMPMQHSRWLSTDHSDCVMRHYLDARELIVLYERGFPVEKQVILTEVSCLAWRALALSQELHEAFGAPLAPAARTAPEPDPDTTA